VFPKLFITDNPSKTPAKPRNVEHFQTYLFLIIYIPYGTKLWGENVRFQQVKNNDHIIIQRMKISKFRLTDSSSVYRPVCYLVSINKLQKKDYSCMFHTAFYCNSHCMSYVGFLVHLFSLGLSHWKRF